MTGFQLILVSVPVECPTSSTDWEAVVSAGGGYLFGCVAVLSIMAMTIWGSRK